MSGRAWGARPSAETAAGVRIERDRELAARDGTILRADLFRPERAEEPLPVLLFRTPYG